MSLLKKYLWTSLKARLHLIQSRPGALFNWLFLPGGPGLGSESLAPLTDILNLPGSIWHVDLPGDGSNHTPDDEKYFSRWSEALFEAVSVLDHVILVAHSTGGMYALATPKLQKVLKGFILMDSSPDCSWLQQFIKYVESHPIEEASKLHVNYAKKPSNRILKKLTLASAPYSFTKTGLQAGIEFLKDLPFNYISCEWSSKNFDASYKAKWVPKKIPTLIFSGEEDRIIPLNFFLRSKKFKRENIKICAIKNAGHFPWIENPKQVAQLFTDYYQMLINHFDD